VDVLQETSESAQFRQYSEVGFRRHVRAENAFAGERGGCEPGKYSLIFDM
jgi:hypothetical protein